jgi:DNA-binding MarR family transcriptional regulator/GNAT superfamily N-acetyltransferase
MSVRFPSHMADRVEAIRAFNRFYTRRIGVLEERLLQSPFSLAEARVLYELAHRKEPTATDIGRELGLDAGYLSRILKQFERKGLIERRVSASDARQSMLRLTAKGRKSFAPLEAKSRDAVRGMLKSLSGADQARILAAAGTIESVLGGRDEGGKGSVIALRTHRPGDLGWIVSRHGEVYAREYGWDERFEALVAKIAAEFIENFDPRRERCWIAEKDGKRVGSVVLVAKSKSIAKLRLLLVEPEARGLGLGKKLVDQCIVFARAAGYRKISLWTQSNLLAARHIYERTGFRLIEKKKHRDFGIPLTGETWELDL